VLLVDNSSEPDIPKNMFALNKTRDEQYRITRFIEEMPEYTQRRFPEIFALLDN